jgi:hypothetical protein
MEFKSISIKKLDKFNLDNLILYNPKENVLLEYQFSLYQDILSGYCFFFNPEVHPSQALAFSEDYTLELLKKSIKKNKLVVLEGNLDNIIKKNLVKTTVLKMLDQKVDRKN